MAAVAQERADGIADSTAVYAMGYDYAYHNPAAREQAVLLTAYNNSEDKLISSSLHIVQDAGGLGTCKG